MPKYRADIAANVCSYLDDVEFEAENDEQAKAKLLDVFNKYCHELEPNFSVGMEDQRVINLYRVGETEDKKINDDTIYLYEHDQPGFASVSWTVGDITEAFNVTEEQAEEFLLKYQDQLRERMTERGWDALETLAAMHGYKKWDSEEQPDAAT